MKIRYLLALVGLAISFALPALAQQKDALDPQLRQVADTLSKKFDAAYDNNDAAAVAALFTEDAVLVTTQGPIYGRKAIEKHYAGVFQKVHFSNHVAKPDQYSPHIINTDGNEMWWNGEWNVTLQGQTGGPKQAKGYWTSIVVREGDTWKDRMQISIVAQAPDATPSPTTTPSNK
jgi:ketosteroid isomerase-like protein